MNEWVESVQCFTCCIETLCLCGQLGQSTSAQLLQYVSVQWTHLSLHPGNQGPLTIISSSTKQKDSRVIIASACYTIFIFGKCITLVVLIVSSISS